MNMKYAALVAAGVVIYMAMRPNRNVRNNNPLNIKEPKGGGDLWIGEHPEDLDGTFEEFESPEYGFRAAARLLKTYREKYGLYSVAEIITRWAPESDNNHTQAYIDYVADKLDKFTFTPVFESEFPALLYWMAEFEGAKGAFTMEQAAQGVAMA